MTTTQKSLPTLYKLTSTGALQQWKIWTEGQKIVTEYGQVGGAIQRTEDVVKEGKNLGKSNATNAEEQAYCEAESQWVKKKKAKNYVETVVEAQAGKVDALVEGGVNPMLAHTFEEQGHKIKFPAACQRKLDGHRCICVVDEDGEATLWSRTRKPINSMPHIIRAVEALGVKGLILDGELFNPEYNDKFEELTSFIRSDEPKAGCEIVHYHIYDLADAELKFRDRQARLEKLIPGSEYLKLVVTDEVQNAEEAEKLMDIFISEGYEGAILRNWFSKYEFKRSYNLQKMKKFQDSEFRIVDVKAGRGKMAECGIFTCDDGHGGTFDCKHEGSLDLLKDFLKYKQNYIGKMLTVKYQGLTKYGVPRFPVSIRFSQPL